ncbi:YggT family protein [Salinibacillus xinjiangensis]|nr:YggT family protein [Salinibacillus xinjiangensis]
MSIVVHALLGTMQFLLGARIVCKLFSASDANFVQWVYRVTDPLVSPFNSYFPETLVGGIFVLELGAIFAIILYTVLGLVLLRLVSRPETD